MPKITEEAITALKRRSAAELTWSTNETGRWTEHVATTDVTGRAGVRTAQKWAQQLGLRQVDPQYKGSVEYAGSDPYGVLSVLIVGVVDAKVYARKVKTGY